MLKLDEFRFRNRFTEDITDAIFTQAIQAVNAQFFGVYSLWSLLPPAERDAKRELCISYLIAWELANSYPESTIGISGSGGMPVRSKRAGPVSISYRDVVRQGGTVLDMLTTNEFGLHALTMLQTAPENFVLVR